MKHIISIILVGFIFVSCQEKKIAFVDNAKLVNEYQEKIDIEAKYKTKIEKFQKKADSASKAFQLEYQDFVAKSKGMSDAKLQEAQGLLGQKQQFLQQQFQAEEQQIAKDSQVENDSLISRVKNFVSDYGKTNGYTYILGANNAGSVLYGSEENDLTQVLLDAINKKYKEENK